MARSAVAPTPMQKLQRIRRVSRPLTFLISLALALTVALAVLEFAVLLLYPLLGSPPAYVSFNAWGLGLYVGHLPSPSPTLIRIDSLTASQRLLASGLAILCASGCALMLFHLRGLFALYSRGDVFGPQNVRRMKRFALWLAATAIAANVSGRVFTAVFHVPPEGVANAALAIVFGAMIYVIAYVSDLGRDADLERKDFV